MTNLILKLKQHISHFREYYVWPALIITLIVGSILGVEQLTGRQVSDSPEALVGFIYNFTGLLLVAFFTVLVDNHLFNDLTPEQWQTATIWEKLLDTSKTLIIFSIAAYALWH